MFAKLNNAESVGKHNVKSSSMSETKSGTSDCGSMASSKEMASGKPEVTQTCSLRPKKQKDIVPSSTMKGLLKGLRYISQIFDNDKEEEEMQIGYPTDVKHVAHIGCDGSSSQAPIWMNEFSNEDANKGHVKSASHEDLHQTGAGIDGLSGSRQRDMPELPKPSRRQPFLGTPSSTNSPSRDQPKQSRRNQSTAGILTSSPSQDSNEGSSRPSRRSQTTALSMDSSLQDQPTDLKKSRRKSKGSSSSGGGSTRPSRSKAQSQTTCSCPLSDPRLGSVCVAGPGSVCLLHCEGEGAKGNHGIS